MHAEPKRPRRDCEENPSLAEAIIQLCCEIREARNFSNLATKADVQEIINHLKIMANEIKDYTTAVNAAFDEIEAAHTAITNSLTGVADDVTFLKTEIDRIQNSPGPITPEDQAALTASQTRVASLQGKMTALKDALAALDAATERPVPPPV